MPKVGIQCGDYSLCRIQPRIARKSSAISELCLKVPVFSERIKILLFAASSGVARTTRDNAGLR